MLRIGFEAIDGDQAAAEAAQLSFGSQRDREDAALLLGSGQCPDNQPILAALAADQCLSVRRAAAAATGRLLSTSPNPLNVWLARKLAEDKGSALPAALLGGILREAPQWRRSLPTPRTGMVLCRDVNAARPQWRGSLPTPRTPDRLPHLRTSGPCRNGGGAFRLPGPDGHAGQHLRPGRAAMVGEPSDSPDFTYMLLP